MKYNLAESMSITKIFFTIDESDKGDVFEEIYLTESEATDAAESDWDRLLPVERKHRTISVGMKTIDMLDADNYESLTGEDLNDEDASAPWWEGVYDYNTVKVIH